jgi:hypothetical protein
MYVLRMAASGRGLEVVRWLGSALAVPLTGLLLYRDHLYRLPIAGIWVLSQLPVKDGHLFVELVPGLREFVESCPSLGLGGTVMRQWLWVRAARGQSHADVAFTCRVAQPRGRHPLGRRRAGGGAGHV